MATYANCQYDMAQHHSTNQSVNTRPKVVEYLSSRFLKAFSEYLLPQTILRSDARDYHQHAPAPLRTRTPRKPPS